jgi:hypothetical protein
MAFDGLPGANGIGESPYLNIKTYPKSNLMPCASGSVLEYSIVLAVERTPHSLVRSNRFALVPKEGCGGIRES